MASSPQQGVCALHPTLWGLGESLRHHQRDSKVNRDADFLWNVSEDSNSINSAEDASVNAWSTILVFFWAEATEQRQQQRQCYDMSIKHMWRLTVSTWTWSNEDSSVSAGKGCSNPHAMNECNFQNPFHIGAVFESLRSELETHHINYLIGSFFACFWCLNQLKTFKLLGKLRI